MNKEIHFWSFFPNELIYNNKCFEMIVCYDETEKAINRNENPIHTTSMLNLSFDLQSKHNYDIYIHDKTCPEGFLISYDNRQCNRTERQLREAHNIAKMWVAGEFNEQIYQGDINEIN